MHPRGGRGVGVERKSWGLASSRVRHPKVVPLPLRHTRWRSSSERNIRKQNVKIRYRSRSTLRRFEEQLTSRGRFFRPTTALPPRRADPARAAVHSPCRGLLLQPDRRGRIAPDRLASPCGHERRRRLLCPRQDGARSPQWRESRFPRCSSAPPARPPSTREPDHAAFGLAASQDRTCLGLTQERPLARRTSARIISRKVTKPAAAAPATASRSVRRSPRALKTVDLALSNSAFANCLTRSTDRCLIRLGCT